MATHWTALFVGAAAGLGMMGPAYFVDYSDPIPGTLMCVHLAPHPDQRIDRVIVIRTRVERPAAMRAAKSLIGFRVTGHHGFANRDWGAMYAFGPGEYDTPKRRPRPDCEGMFGNPSDH